MYINRMGCMLGIGVVLCADSLMASNQDTQTKSKPNVPFFRTAEAYLTLAEATLRNGGSQKDALNAINVLRRRAHAEELSSITLDEILDEKAREFYFEGQRRTDLIRYGYFTGGDYLWDWKGGVKNGTSVNSQYDVYPIPSSDINVNENLVQNKGY